MKDKTKHMIKTSERIANFINEKGTVTTISICNEVSMAVSTVLKYLKALSEIGFINQIGHNVWRWNYEKN